jgi:hypothetical protein
MYFTLFTSDGEVTQLKKKPSREQACKILDCKNIEEMTIGVFYNNKDHHDATLLMDDYATVKQKPINHILNTALNSSLYWKNVDGRTKYGSLVVLGDAIIVSHEPLIA